MFYFLKKNVLLLLISFVNFFFAEKIQSEAANVFSDAIEDFYLLKNILDRFLRWRKQDYDAYEQAFVDLCLPKILSPLVRLEMITWNPIEVNFFLKV